MMLCIIGNNDVSLKLKDAAVAGGLEAQVIDSVDAFSGTADMVILNTEGDLQTRQAQVAALTKKTAAPIAGRISLDYACALAKETEAKGQVVAIRTMEDLHIGEYIELTRTFDTDDAVYAKALEILKAFNGYVAEVPDVIGGIFYRTCFLYSNMGAFLVSEGVTVVDVDNSIQYGNNIKFPPMRIADEIGLDRMLEILTVLYQETGRPAYRPCPLIKQLVNAGRVGKKCGQGFYKYD